MLATLVMQVSKMSDELTRIAAELTRITLLVKESESSVPAKSRGSVGTPRKTATSKLTGKTASGGKTTGGVSRRFSQMLCFSIA